MFSLAKELHTTMASVTSPADLAEDLAADPQHLADDLRFRVTRLARLLRQQSDSGLTPTQLAALATLDRRGPISIGALAEEEQIGAPTATKIVDKLAAAGLVERLADARDRRVTRLQITPAGQRLLAELRARKTAWLSSRVAALPDADRATLAAAIAVLDQLAAPPAPNPPEDER
jgi:DNA-binding MarR family transcriptional regulator